MTLTQYEASLTSMPAGQATVAAGPAFALRQAIAIGEPFVASRDRIAGDAWHARKLDASLQTSNFATLSGP
jgi:hypothetical protein